MARLDDYKQALDLGVRDLANRSPDLLAGFAGAEVKRDLDGKESLVFSFLNQKMRVSLPEMTFMRSQSHEELPIQEQILLVHYLQGAWSSGGASPMGEWISFQEIPDGRFYMDAFQRRAKIPMVQTFGGNPDLLVRLAKEVLGAASFQQGDASVLVKALPLASVALILWRGDEEFPPEGNILFDRSISRIFSAEDIAWLSGMVVYPLITMSKTVV